MFHHSQIARPWDYFWLSFVAEPGFWLAEAAKVAVLMVPVAILISLRTIAKIVSMVFWFDWFSNKLTGSTIRAAVIQHWNGKALSFSNGRRPSTGGGTKSEQGNQTPG
jgi:hypothetical protein